MAMILPAFHLPYNMCMLFGFLTYGLWGFFPAFFPLLLPAQPIEIIAHRILWTAVFMLIILLFTKELPALIHIPARTWLWVFIAAILIALNWLLYVWAINAGHVADAALGYFINPLVTILCARIFFKEKLRLLSRISVVIASIAVLFLTFLAGQPPIVALGLAFSFAFYGVIKKRITLSPLVSLTAETLVITPCALLYLFFLHKQGTNTFLEYGPSHALLLISAGLITAVPLICFGIAAQRIHLSTLGMLQYLTPTMQLLWALFINHEYISAYKWVGFIIIWCAVILYMYDAMRISKTV